jgi:probable F420-dependent oxidoreductase
VASLDMAEEIGFALQATPATKASWIELARAAEADGFDALCVADHPGTTGSPFVALAAAAAVTERIQLGTAVVNGGVCQAFTLANDVATLDLLSGGRAYLGLGAGHTPAEWEMVGQEYPSADERVDRFAELLATVPALVAGETVSFTGAHLQLVDARLAVTQGRRVPLLVGGSNRRLLRLGAEHADLVEISGSGRTLPDGHYHETRWSPADIARSVGVVRDAAAKAGRRPALSALVQFCELTEEPERWMADRLRQAAAVIAPDRLPSVEDALASPYTLVGTLPQLVGKLTAMVERWGISRYTVRSSEPIAPVIAAIRREKESPDGGRPPGPASPGAQ